MSSTLRMLDDDIIPEVDWDTFYNSLVWMQGEHMAMIGPTGRGKTNLSMLLLPLRTYVTVFATKPQDDSLDLYVDAFGYKKLTEWQPKLSAEKYPRRILWPDARSLKNSQKNQERVFGPALDDIFGQGSWCVYLDELWWMSYILPFKTEVKIYLQQGRSLGLSLVCATQRPAWVPLEIFDQSTHLFFWADNDKANLDRISGIGGFDSLKIRACIQTLRPYEVLYINTRDHTMSRVFPPLIIPKHG